MSGRIPAVMRLILNADDFGRSTGINHAVIRAHRQGLLTSTSLMVTGQAAAEATDLARQTPTLAVGLHLVLADGRPASPAAAIPHLVDPEGGFPDNPAAAGWHYFRSREARKELAGELRAQFELFASSGLPLSHVDGHCHLHMHPAVFPLVVSLARKYGAGGIRVVRDAWRLGLDPGDPHFLTRVGWTLCFALLARWCRRRLRSSPLPYVSRVCGLLRTGRMSEDYVARLLHNLDVPTAEIYFHPAESGEHLRWGANMGDLETLLSVRLARIIEEQGIRLASYPELGNGWGA
jgi:hopanoid biosynthesis associated protein HpnK